jgi:surface antigen
MVGSFVRLAAAAAFSAALAGCASGPANYPEAPQYGDIATPQTPLQCVPFAREHAGIAIYGDAYTWWNQAAGRYARSSAPSDGAVMVLVGYAGAERAHLAVVRKIIDSRDISVDHANWLDDGQVYLDDPVRDVSMGNDWSQVRVYNVKAQAWGARTYSVQGFIGPGPDGGAAHVAQNPPAARRNDPIAEMLTDDLADDDN